MLLFGCITTKTLKNGTVLERSIKLLNKGETIYIFPSGELERKKKKYTAKVGVAYLIKNVKNSLIVPVKIKYEKNKISIGHDKVFTFSKFSKDLQPYAEKIYDRIKRINLINTKKLYELPWTTYNNPNGWIEPTTYCQLQCPGCYRGLAEKNPIRKHIPLDILKKEINWFIKKRNVQTISIAGGEPLCYPKLDDLVKYIYSCGLKTKIYTNAVLLTKKRLKKLKKIGVTEIIIHVDKSQRKNFSESQANKLRQKYCDLFKDIGGVNLGFIMPLSKQNIGDLEVLSKFYQKNSDIINLIVFTVYKEMLPEKTIQKQMEISMQEVSEAVKSSFGIKYCSFLGKENSNNISWLFSLSAYVDGKLIDSFDNRFYKLIQERYYKKKKKYFFTVKNKPMIIQKLIPLLFNSSVRKIFLRSIIKGKKKINPQVILIIDPPSLENNKWDLCKGCPDPMIHNGNLVPSCLLERIKKGEKIRLF
jgi:organic radical activating enzyme